MSGEIIFRAVPKDPPCYCQVDAHLIGVVPGTVWQCECGKTWVFLSDQHYRGWESETKGKRRRRERQMARATKREYE